MTAFVGNRQKSSMRKNLVSNRTVRAISCWTFTGGVGDSSEGAVADAARAALSRCVCIWLTEAMKREENPCDMNDPIRPSVSCGIAGQNTVSRDARKKTSARMNTTPASRARGQREKAELVGQETHTPATFVNPSRHSAQTRPVLPTRHCDVSVVKLAAASPTHS